MKNATSFVSQLAIVAGLAFSINAPASADQVILDDLIVDGSACVGLDCVNGESFGFDTLRIKENNVRIHFDDTSTTASFPSNDWRLIANDSGNGGANYFAIEDSTAGRIPFRVEAGAPANTLYVEDGGRVGFGTSTPVVNMHVVEGNTPTLRLEQDGSNGFTPQTYDVAANEANFFIRDVTNGSSLFFRAKPGAPEDSIFIAADGDIGLGTDGPDNALHIRQSGASSVRFEDSALSVEWEAGLAGNDTYKISAVGASGVQFRFTRDGGFIPQRQGAAPASPESGMIYNDTSGALCWYNSGAWVVVAGAGSCG